MSCEVYLFRREFIDYDVDVNTDVCKLHRFWIASSYELGAAFAETLGIAEGCWKSVCLDEFTRISLQMIAEGKDEYREYRKGALKVVVDRIQRLDEETKQKSDWFVTLDIDLSP